MYRQLFKENALGQAIAKTKRVQHINFTIEPAQAFDEGIARQAIEIILLLKGLHQGIPLLLDPGKVAERRIAQAFGATIVRAAQVMHGKTSLIEHNGEGVFQGLNNPLTVTRYHSLVIDPPTLPSEFNVTARSASGEIMGIRHREWDLEGVQFHPESILSEQGHQLLANFLKR